ncbi:MAG: hypothetical protein HRU03_08860 [Nanoarchaeales archaeon]|nr:hypothetical protein [Nanoarchaeales archaeon]
MTKKIIKKAIIVSGLAALIDFNTSFGMMFFIPGGLFELFLPFWLFFKGFNLK